MHLFDAPKNDGNQRRVPSGYYLAPLRVSQSENTSSLYAYVGVYEDEDCGHHLANGWISLSSDNFVVDNY